MPLSLITSASNDIHARSKRKSPVLEDPGSGLQKHLNKMLLSADAQLCPMCTVSQLRVNVITISPALIPQDSSFRSTLLSLNLAEQVS